MLDLLKVGVIVLWGLVAVLAVGLAAQGDEGCDPRQLAAWRHYAQLLQEQRDRTEQIVADLRAQVELLQRAASRPPAPAPSEPVK